MSGLHPITAYLHGSHYSDAQFARMKARLITSLRKDPETMQCVFEDWPDARVEAVAQPLLEELLRQPGSGVAVAAGARWPPSRFRRYGQTLAEKLRQDPAGAYKALKKWDPQTADAHYPLLLDGITKSAEYSYYAATETLRDAPRVTPPRGRPATDPQLPRLVGAFAHDPHYCHRAITEWYHLALEQFLPKLAEAPLKVPEYCYKAGKAWRQEEFVQFELRITAGLVNSPTWAAQSCQDWPENRFCALTFALLDHAPLTGASKPHYSHLDAAEIRLWWQIRLLLGGEAVLAVPSPAFPLLTRARAFAAQVGQDDAYFEGLAQALKNDAVLPWAKTIVESFTRPEAALERVGARL